MSRRKGWSLVNLPKEEAPGFVVLKSRTVWMKNDPDSRPVRINCPSPPENAVEQDDHLVSKVELMSVDSFDPGVVGKGPSFRH